MVQKWGQETRYKITTAGVRARADGGLVWGNGGREDEKWVSSGYGLSREPNRCGIKHGIVEKQPMNEAGFTEMVNAEEKVEVRKET